MNSKWDTTNEDHLIEIANTYHRMFTTMIRHDHEYEQEQRPAREKTALIAYQMGLPFDEILDYVYEGTELKRQRG